MGKGHSDPRDEDLPSTGTERTARMHKVGLKRYSYKAKKGTKSHYKSVKVHHRRVRTRKEETGKEILERIIRELNASIRKKERAKKRRKK